MPIANKDLGKYKRPGIFIEEINNSFVELPVQDVLINLVPGFSIQGPVNTPVYVDNTVDFENVYGSDNPRLENKGAFFHKSVKKMLESGPVWALNLLPTDDNRDLLGYSSVSASAYYDNTDFTDPTTKPYSRYFNRQDFWERDPESFLSLVNDPTPDTTRLLHLTNMGNKAVSVFIFKSSITGFDVQAETWYGGVTKVPTYVHPKSWISDFMVTVLIIAGDWSDYNTLSVDPTWSEYFTANGLVKTSVEDFVNENGVVVLGNYDCSLLPNFKDLDNRDMYIKNNINNDTDKTGLFCTYNEDLLLDSDYPTDKVDLIGDTLVGQGKTSINFLSYDEAITEALTFEEKNLDSAGNTFGNYGTSMITEWVSDRTGIYSEGYVNRFMFHSATTVTNSAYTFTDNGIGSVDPYYVIGGVQYSGFTSPLTATVDSIAISSGTTGASRYDALYVDADQVLKVVKGVETLGLTPTKPNFSLSDGSTIVLGYAYVRYSGATNGFSSYTGITVDETAYMPLGATDVTITTGVTTTAKYLTITFLGTSGTTALNDYAKRRRIKAHQVISDGLVGGEGVIINSGTGYKYAVVSPTIVDPSTSINASIKVWFGLTDIPNAYFSSTSFIFYYVDDEQYFGDTGLVSGVTTSLAPFTESTQSGVVGKYSSFYLDFKNGYINDSDHFFENNDTGGTKVYIRMYLANEELRAAFVTGVDVQAPFWIEDFTADYGGELIIHSDKGNWKQTIEIEDTVFPDPTLVVEINVDKNRYSEIVRGDFLEAYYDESYYAAPYGEGYLNGETPKRLTRIVQVVANTTNSDWKTLKTESPIRIYEASGGTGDYQTMSYPSIDEYVSEYKSITLMPFTKHADSLPNGTEARQSEILDVIAKGTALANGLANKNKISWRYLVDSFGLGLADASKQQYLDLCGKKLNCLGFINMPSAKDFKKSLNPSFINDDYTLNTAYVAAGGDDTRNPDFLYSFGTGVGQGCVGYFFPYVKIDDNGIPKFIPPAAHAATAYMWKHITTTAGVYPWTVVAGVNTGRILGIATTEMDFTDTDLENFHGMGANPITYFRNYGYAIGDESTAAVFPVSSLSYLHSREVLIELENRLYDMLLRYQWKFNTSSVRNEIKFRADQICKELVDTGGALYDFRNVCDKSNNTNYIIDLQMGILSTFVEIVKSMGTLINQITIERTGAISSTGFISA